MKYAIIIPDGCADEAQESLGGKTPLEAARVTAMDAVAAAGVVGRATFVPDALPAGSDVANLGLFGYDPVKCYTGRAPLEAVAQGIRLGADDWALRCNLVTIEDQVMRSFTAGHISNEEAAALVGAAQESLGSERIEFRPGVSYRNLVVCRDAAGVHVPFSEDTRTTPPHDLTDRSVMDDYPRGPGSDLLAELMDQSMTLFADHPVNVARRAAGKPAATSMWLWGQGRVPRLAPFAELHGKRGAMITAVDLLRGLAALMGWRRIDVPGATGYTDTDYAAKGRYACAALADVDLVAVHVEATDEASHEGDVAAKIEALEQIDRHIVGPLHEALRAQGDYRILVTPDHPTPLRTKTHAHGAVPFAMAGRGIAADGAAAYDERTGAASGLVFDEGWRLMSFFLGEDS
ncbi:MAG TPA: cofactor-independent phosphoglycerate mutase [Thermoguttaceae bacterium]|nr:cofactor-independent phosphoglycerate mutase [Thermoguttaceae bacterium]